MLNSFSAGVFLAMALTHILPEAVEHYAEICEDHCFPLPFFLTFVGYVMILFLDKVALGNKLSNHVEEEI